MRMVLSMYLRVMVRLVLVVMADRQQQLKYRKDWASVPTHRAMYT